MGGMTENERALLRALPHDVGHCIADPGGAVEGWRAGHGSGGGGGFNYELTNSAIVAAWHEWVPVKWAGPEDIRGEGVPIGWRKGALLREAKVPYMRLQRWCESLPAEVRAQAVTWWRTCPEDTRDIAALVRLTLQQLADPEPVDLLGLLDAQS
jgi:hypothetical protein